MNTKTRIQKLESAKPGHVETDNRQLKRYIGADGNKFYIDGVEVNYNVYVKAETAQIEAAKARGEEVKINVSIIGLDAIQEDADGVQ
jgi:uncharacterized protein YpmS